MLDLVFAVVLYLMGKSLDKTRMVRPAEDMEYEPMVMGQPITSVRSKTYLKGGESWEDLT